MAEHIDWYLSWLERRSEETRDWIEKLDEQIASTRMGIESIKKLRDSRTSRDGVKADGVSLSNGHERV